MSTVTVNQDEWRDFLPNVHDTYPFIDPAKEIPSTSSSSSPSNNTSRGRSVLITGASKGIGLLTATRFATAGFTRIALAARSPLDAAVAAVKQAAHEAGHTDPPPHVLALHVDVCSADSLRAAAEKKNNNNNNTGGGLDVLVNNAGYLERWARIDESDPLEWWRTWEVNVHGVYLACKYFLPLVLRSELKTVVNVSSVGALAARPTSSAYATTKFAVCRLTEFLHNDHSRRGLVAIAVHPGAVKTELAQGMPEHMHAVLIDEPALPADAMLWLVRERRPWLSGRMVSCNWNFEELEARKQEIVDQDLLKFKMAL
ncbi:hypothetical protein BD289DRAFT_419526 [Coniella lustricola]|uniref:Ketoreductase domain-containing protein n=1 Tax=Coniella lustricola TaxID=2025994 RepID=A0A2T2ZRR5_9PEZI|nr:hypothetical protein BD289DRAFT_419526 [Coniella lustricola]